MKSENIRGLTLKYLVTLKKLDVKECYRIRNETLFEVIEMPNLKKVIFDCSIAKKPALINYLERIRNVLKSRISAITLILHLDQCSIRIISIKSEIDSKIMWEIDERFIKGGFKPAYSTCDISLFIEKLVKISKIK